MRVGLGLGREEKGVRAGLGFAALGSWLRFLWLLVALFGFGVLASVLPEAWRMLGTPCSDAACQPGQPTAAGLEQLARLGLPTGLYRILTFGFAVLIPSIITLVMGVLIWKKPRDLTVLALAFGGVACSLLGALGLASAKWSWLEGPGRLFEVLAGAGLAFGLLAFPNGRFVPRWGQWLAYPLVLTSLFALWPASWGEGVALSGFLLIFPVSLVLLLCRYRLSGPATRVQIKWVLYGIGVMVLALLDSLLLGVLLPAPWNEVGAPGDLLTSLLGGGSILFFWLCLAVSVYRHNLFDVDLVIRRTLRYGGLTLMVLLLYGAFVAVASLLGGSSTFVSFLLVGGIAVAFHPLRVRLQRSINRLLYGQRSEPYAVVSSLTERLSSLLEPAEVFGVTVETVATALKLPFVEIALGAEGRAVASYGTPQGERTHLPLRYAGEVVGRLSVSPREGEVQLARADQRLLSDLAQQVSVSAHACLLRADLERTRLGLVSAREEARRTLGNDLHDSVGHSLAGLTRRAEAASRLLLTDPEGARVLLDELSAGSRAAGVQVRALAHRLHPPELELLGLVGALRECVEAGYGTLYLTLEAEPLPRLPAAVEVAAYYTAQEALHNVRRHAHARYARVRLELRGATTLVHPALATRLLELEVTDDGCGFADHAPQGLGLRSMTARAAELGGHCRVTSREGGGTRVLWQVPCPEV